jgi:hypothetical protein
MKPIILMILLTMLIGACKQQADLTSIAPQIESITVYDLEGLGGLKYSETDLSAATQATINPDLFKGFARQAKFKDGWVLWKGSSLAVLKLKDGKEKRLALSYYGGFFATLGESGYYYLEGESRQQFEQVYEQIIRDKFIPKRTGRSRKEEKAQPTAPQDRR